MESSVTIKSKTIEKAIQSALEILDARKDEVHISILQNPSRRFFGISKQLAEVKVTKNNDAPPLAANKEERIDKSNSIGDLDFDKLIDRIQIDKLEESIHSKQIKPIPKPSKNFSDEQPLGIWIDSGKITVNASPSHYPILSAGKNVDVFVNGQKVNSKRIVSGEDQIEVKFKDEIIQTNLSIKLHDNDMEARLRILPWKNIIRTLVDTKPEISLCIEATEEIIPSNELTPVQVMQHLKDMNISEGIDYAAIKTAVETLETLDIVIAKGVKPLDGRDGDVNILFDNEIFNFVKEQQQKIDFREMNQVINVEDGQILAKILPPIQGRPGKDVFGNIIHPKTALSVDVRASKRVVIRNDEIIAAASGRPSIERRGRLIKVDIIKELIHYGDLTIETGNIRFQGDVRIKGDVTDDMIIEAAGKIVVEGMLSKSSLQSSQSVFVAGNVFSSQLSVGKANMLINELNSLLKEMLTNLDSMILAIQQLLSVNKQTEENIPADQLNHLIRLLTEKKYPGIREIIHSFYQKVMSNDTLLDEEWMDVANKLHQQFIILFTGNKTTSFKQLVSEVRNLYELYSVPPEPKSNLVIPYAINSSLYCSGNIYVNGQGTYHCQIQAGNDVRISGVCRGGEIVAGHNVRLDETGSEIGVKTVIRVPLDGTIDIQHVHPGTLIQIGNRVHTFTVEEFNIKGLMGKDGMIRIR